MHRNLSATCLSLALSLGLGSLGAAEPARFEVTVAAGDHDRANTPVVVPIGLPESTGADDVDVTLSGGESPIGGQITGRRLTAQAAQNEAGGPRHELHFILPELAAGKSLVLQLELPTAAAGGKAGEKKAGYHHATNDQGTETTWSYAHPVLKYVHPTLDETDAKTREATYKPFHHLYSPDGSRIVTKGPGGQFTHHRGIYFGFNRITYGDGQTCDVWHCKPGAHQAHEKLLGADEGSVVGRHRLQIGWHGAKGEKFADEQRELTLYAVPALQFVEFASVVRTTDKPIRLDGDPQHAGFHFRADNEVAATTKSHTYFLRPDGPGKPGETRNWDAKKRDPKTVDEPWKVMSFLLGETRYSALYLDHPKNPKEARSSERDYGRFGTYFEYEITPDRPLEVHYRLLLKQGEFTAEDARRLSADFVEPPEVTVTPVK